MRIESVGLVHGSIEHGPSLVEVATSRRDPDESDLARVRRALEGAPQVERNECSSSWRLSSEAAISL
ncbi:MAG: hypothetical protein ACR2LY_03635 [Thermoleophilaceae bacterium]